MLVNIICIIFLAHIIIIIYYYYYFFGLNFDTAKKFLRTFLDQRKRVYPNKSLTRQKNTSYFSLASQQLKLNSLTLSFSANSRSFSKNHCEISLIFFFLISHSLCFLNSYHFNFVTSLFSFSSPLPFIFSQLSLHQNHNGPFNHQRNLLFLFHPTI